MAWVFTPAHKIRRHGGVAAQLHALIGSRSRVTHGQEYLALNVDLIFTSEKFTAPLQARTDDISMHSEWTSNAFRA